MPTVKTGFLSVASPGRKATLLMLAGLASSFIQFNYIVPDDYPVTNKMLAENHSARAIDSIYSFWDMAIFKNDSLREALVVQLGTDYFRTGMYHFKTNAIPREIIADIIFSNPVSDKDPGDTTRYKKMAGMFKKYVSSAKNIDTKYFKTKQGLFLGMNKNALIAKFGKPHKDYFADGLEILRWDFPSEDYAKNYLKIPKNEPVVYAKTIAEYHVTALMQSNIMVALALQDDMP